MENGSNATNIEGSIDESLGLSSITEIDSQDQLEERLAVEISGRLDGFRHTILSLVVEGRYDTAIAEISYYSSSDHKLQVFKRRARRYLNHCEELIRAIESKVKFCQTRTITRSQKHELYTMVLKHFRDLTDSLKKIERIENDIRVTDLKSTVWVLKAFIMSVGVMILFGMIREGVYAMKEPLLVVTDDAIEFLFKLIRF
jgi:hypothetical protein